MPVAQGTVIQDFQISESGSVFQLKKGDSIKVLAKVTDGTYEIKLTYPPVELKCPQNIIDVPANQLSGLPEKKPVEKKLSLADKLKRRFTVNLNVGSPKQSTPPKQQQQEEVISSPVDASPSQSQNAAIVQPQVVAASVQPSSLEDLRAQIQEAEKPKMTEQEAARVIKKNVVSWYYWKKFRLYYKKHADLKEGRLRKQALMEIITTERTYARQLGNLVTKYYEQFSEKGKYAKILKKDEIDAIFGSVAPIRQQADMFLMQLETEIKKYPNPVMIGPIFNKMAPFMKLYTSYINNYDNSVAVIEKLEKKNKQFRELLLNQQLLMECDMLNLPALLILPVQRIPRYRLLLQELLKRTPSDHVDYQNLEKALNAIIEIAAKVNEAKKQAELSQIAFDLQKQLAGRFQNFLQAHRSVVRKGDLYVECDRKGIADWYSAVLFTDSLILLPTEEGKDIIRDTEVIMFMFADYIDVEEKDDENDEEKKDDERLWFAVDAMQKSEVNRFIFTLEHLSEREEWEGEISLYIAEQQKKAMKKGIDNSIHSKKDRVEKKRNKAAHKIPIAKMAVQKMMAENSRLQESLQKYDNSIRDLENQYEQIWAKLEEDRSNRDKLIKDISDLTEKQHNFSSELETHMNAVENYDAVIWQLLSQDLDAFREVFAEDQPYLPEHMLAKKSGMEGVSSQAQVVEVKQEIKKPQKIEGENPYLAYAKQRIYDLQFMKIPTYNNVSDVDVDFINPLFALKPMLKWFKIEQEALTYKYKVDRLHHGNDHQEKPPINLPYDPVFDNEEVYKNDLLEYRNQHPSQHSSSSAANTPRSGSINTADLPDDPVALKEIIASLKQEISILKEVARK